MKKVSQLLKRKGNEVWSVAPDDSVYDAIRMMSEKSVGALMVMDGKNLVGIVSERDYARRVILQGRSSRDTTVREIMTTKVFHAIPSQTIRECLAVMTEKRIRHLPVVDGSRVVGVVSIGDLVKEVIADQRITIEQLERYISG